MVSTVLIANRGEIALRIARTCRELGLATIAVHSTADRESAVVRLADRAVQIGPAEARRSYRNAAALVQAAICSGADAIHPGYGFLSEEPDFAEICEAAGITFIGPPARVMAQLGDKVTARQVADDVGLEVLPGSRTVLRTVEEAEAVVAEIGYPVIVKAAAGGGGRGMVVARDRAHLGAAFAAARTIAQAVFGDNRVYVERYLDDARHVEVQVLGDRHGHVVHLGERDCSVQRRHQKLVEETPSPSLGVELRTEIGEAAARAAAAIGYVGAGTFEFVLDDDDKFFFLEVNCRLQVEHPVTEMVTGVDLVREQILIADGHGLTFRQADVEPRGVAVECRINAEDPARDFLPTPGVLTEFLLPGGPFTRVDTHAFPGWTVTTDYDSLLAKLAVWAPDRAGALARMSRALDEFYIAGSGMRTTVGFLHDVIAHPAFRTARHRTSLVSQMQADPSAGRH